MSKNKHLATIQDWLSRAERSVTISHSSDGYSVELYDNEREPPQDGDTFEEALEAAAEAIENGEVDR